MSRVFANVNTDHLDVASNLTVSAVPLTIAIWFKRTGTGSVTQRNATLGTSGSTDNHWALNINVANDGVRAETRTTGGSSSEKTAQTVDSVWHHNCGVFSSNSSRTAYLDGVAGTPETTGRTPVAGGINLFRLGNSPATAFPTAGKIAHAAVWNTTLTQTDITNLAAGANPKSIKLANLVAYWPLDTGSTLADAIGANNLTATGTTADNADNPTIAAQVMAPTFSVSPTVTAPTTDGYTVGFTASTASTVHVVALLKNTATPSVADVIAHTGAAAFATKAVTGADSVTLTGLVFPKYDLYAVLTNIAGDTSLVSLLAQQKSPASGYQYRTFTSVAAEPYTLITSPAVAAADVEELFAATLPGVKTLTALADGNYSYASDGSRQYYDYRIYDDSAQGWMAIAGGGTYARHWINNQTPYLFDTESEISYTLPFNSAIVPIDLRLVAGDAEADALTVTAVTTEPSGIAVASSIVTGTALVSGTYPVTYRWTDVPGDSFTATVTYLIGDITVPNLVGLQGADAFAVLLDAQLSGVLIYELNGTVEPGIVLSQSPAAGATAPPFSEVAIVVAQGLGYAGPLVDLIAFSGPRQATNRSAIAIDVVLRNRTGRVPATPANFYWRVDEITSGREIQGWTSVTPDSQITLNITADQNTMRQNSRSFERRQIIIATDFGLDTQYLQTMTYDLRN
jgi:hypothetical protein